MQGCSKRLRVPLRQCALHRGQLPVSSLYNHAWLFRHAHNQFHLLPICRRGPIGLPRGPELLLPSAVPLLGVPVFKLVSLLLAAKGSVATTKTGGSLHITHPCVNLLFMQIKKITGNEYLCWDLFALVLQSMIWWLLCKAIPGAWEAGQMRSS